MDIATFIANDNPNRAFTFVDEIEAHCRRLADTPGFGRMQEDWPSGIRMIPHGQYLIFYRQLDNGIRIERILNGVRDYWSFLG